jgi:hypothetical protein
VDTDAEPPKPKRTRTRKKKVRGFHIPPTLAAAERMKLKDADLSGEAYHSLTSSRPMMIADDVPVGHFWKLGWVNGTDVNVCYKTRDGGCHWKLLPQSNIPEWDPDGIQ